MRPALNNQYSSLAFFFSVANGRKRAIGEEIASAGRPITWRVNNRRWLSR